MRVQGAGHVGVLRASAPLVRRVRADGPQDRGAVGCRSLRAAVASVCPMATFSIRFLGCKVSHADAHAIREALLHDGHVEGSGGEIAVVNTCCVTHEAVRKSRQAAARAARTHRRVYVTGCGANLDGAFDGLPDNVTVVARPGEEAPAAVAGDVG